MPPRASKRKAIILGFDGLDPKILEKLMAQGEVPHFTSLAQSGYFSPLKTMAPPQSPVVWATLATGVNPAKHGIYDFLTRDPGAYTPKLSFLKQGKLGYCRPFAARTFWEVAGDQGIPATIIKWPLTFPATPVNGYLLSGLGTPDIRGTLGRYTYITSRDLAEAEKPKGTIIRVNPGSGRIHTRIAGPLQISLHGITEATTDLEIETAERSIRCRVGGTTFSLQNCSWSPWIAMSFKVGFLRTVTGMARFYLETAQPQLNLYVTPINFSNDTRSPPLSYPSGYGKEIAAIIGPHATLGLAEDNNALNDELIDEKAFIGSCNLLMEEREKIYYHILDRFQEGILAVVFDTADRIQHMLWRYLDPMHPRYEEKTAPEFAGVVAGYYRRMDNLLGRALDKADKDTLIIACSDHGFTDYRRSVHLNTWLRQSGFLTLKAGKSRGDALFAGVDWSSTKAFAFGLNSIFLNVRHREQQGAIDPTHVQALTEELIRHLQALTDCGTPVLKNIYKTTEHYGPDPTGQAPDLIIGYQQGYRNSWQTAVGESPDSDVVEDNRLKWSGDHCCDPDLVPGIFLCNKTGLLQDPTALDLSPAILEYLR
jgi:predicted AlkP superfamily phosphohydrolase/phosphomutase